MIVLGVGCRHFGLSEHARLLQREPTAQKIGDQTCVSCHPQQGQALSRTVHRDVLGCESCHGPGSLHIGQPPLHIAGPKQLLAMSTLGQSEMCLECRPPLVPAWPGANHSVLACFQCHSDVVHFAPKKGERPPRAFLRQDAFCDQCHAADTADFRQIFHHPVPEGQMTCAACHNVHAKSPKGIPLLDGSACARCHPREGGAKVFRHVALDDGCQVCHAGHGSPIRALLTQEGNSLCLQCHFQANFPVIEGIDHRAYLARGAACYDCHVEVHGSDSDPSLLGRLR
jgi:DmsE family decaheme c-type cytochrome